MVKTAVAHPNFNHWQHTNWDIQCTQVQDSNCLNNITPKNTSKFIQHNALFFICLCKFKFKKKLDADTALAALLLAAKTDKN